MTHYIKELIIFLEDRLCNGEDSQTMKIGPRTFLYLKDNDNIYVKIMDREMIILTDGDKIKEKYLAEDIRDYDNPIQRKDHFKFLLDTILNCL